MVVFQKNKFAVAGATALLAALAVVDHQKVIYSVGAIGAVATTTTKTTNTDD